MSWMVKSANFFQDLLDSTRTVDFLGPLLLRVYLAPVFWMAGSSKIKLGSATDADGWLGWLKPREATVQWFGNPDWGLGMPVPELMAFLAGWSELGGAVLLLIGLATRWISIPLMVTMVVAMVTVHWQNGWLAIASGTGPFATERTIGAAQRLDRATAILREHGNYAWLTENGAFVVLNNGIEFAATYFIMLVVLFFAGGGSYFSLDYWLAKKYRR